jgi:hypothetical protein
MFKFSLSELAKKLYRKQFSINPAEQIKYDRKLIFCFSSALIATFFIFAYYFALDADNWYEMHPEIVIEKEAWKVLIDPENKDLTLSSKEWSEAKPLTHPEVADKLKKGQVQQVWLRLDLSEEAVQLAARKNAFYYRLGFLIGNINIWLDDQQLVYIPSSYTGSIDLAMPIHKMKQGKAMSLTIQMIPREGARNLVPLALGVKSGLVAYKTGASFMRFNHFINRSRPMALFFVYSLFSMIFFVLWISNRVQREYLHLASFALVNSLPPLLFSDAFTTGRLKDTNAIVMYLLIVLAQGASVLSLGFSFARSHSEKISKLIWGSLFLGYLTIFLLPNDIRLNLRQTLNQTVLPISFLLGSLICYSQARFLNSSDSGIVQPRRVYRLRGFALAMGLLAILYYVQFHAQMNYVTKQLLFDLPALGLVIFLGMIALSDYRHQSRLIKKIPTSNYHRQMPLPEKLSGAVMTIDLKNSEKYFDYAKQTMGFESVLPSVLSHIWSVINQAGGAILKAEGDEVVAFFENSSHENPLMSALQACDRISKQLNLYSEEIQAQYDGFENQYLHFRAAISFGDLKPIWIQGANGRLPGWVQLGDSMVFVEAARLLEIEKDVEKKSEEKEVRSRVLVQSVNASQFTINQNLLGGRFVAQRQQYVGKHDRLYIVDVYHPDINHSQKLRIVG